ncbi:MAG: peptidyl-tRNA hydrolase Pth2 [Candidatus Woesearchaeota archaeon]
MKQAILVVNSLKLPKGKLAAQVAHAAVEAAHRADKEDYKLWRSTGMAKIVLKVPDEKSLHKHVQAAKEATLPTATITDAGKTVVAPGTVTCAAIGPAAEETIDSITADLALL